MPVPHVHQQRAATRWTGGILVIFTLMGLGFGSWLSRIPAVRDHLGASTLEMSIFGFVLAAGSVLGLVLAGHTVSWLGPRRTLAIGVLVQLVAMPAAGMLFWVDAVVPAVACLAVFGFVFGTSDVAMNVSGASAEQALGKPRMPLLHAGFSLGSVTATALGALAEAIGISVPVHLSVMYLLIAIGVFCALRVVPRTEADGAVTEADNAVDDSVGEAAAAAAAGSGIARPAPTNNPADPVSAAPAAASRSPWRDPRVLAVGLIVMSMSLAEGTASDWLPLALADGRGASNQHATLMLSVFFISMTVTRLGGSWLLGRFGRVPVLRVSAVLVLIGVSLLILVAAPWASVLGVVLWGMGAALGFPIGISAAADNPATATRDVAAVAAIAYTALLLGPMIIGFLGEHLGLLSAFWPLTVFAALAFLLAKSAKEPAPARLAP